MSKKHPLLLQLIAKGEVKVKLRDKLTVGAVEWPPGSTPFVSGEAAFRLLMRQKAVLVEDVPVPTAQPAEAAEPAPTVATQDETADETLAGFADAKTKDVEPTPYIPRKYRSKG